MARRPGLNRGLTWFHRWAGVVLCLFFLMWFASGAVLHFVGFPSLPDEERFSHSEPLDAAAIRVAPAEALAAVTGPQSLALIGSAAGPVYLVGLRDQGFVRLSARDGAQQPAIDAPAARAIALRFAGFGGAAQPVVAGPFDYDQWIVHQRFDPYRPFFRVALGDAGGTELYVSSRTGQVLQRTDGRARAWNWCGAIVHWIYFTPLRQSWSAWNQVVWWLSLAALLSALVGTWLGLVRWLANRRAGRRGLSPFRGWLRWHHVIGLFAAVVTLVYIFSGWLSMDHGRLFSRGIITPQQQAAYAGRSLAEVAAAVDVPQLQALPPATEVDFGAVAGGVRLSLRGAARADSVPAATLQSAVAAAWPGAVPAVDEGSARDAMFRLAEGIPESARAFVAGGADGTRIYADAATGQLVAVLDASRRAYAWTYYALHTFNFPALIARPAWRTTLVMVLMAFGFGFSVTGVAVAYQVLRRQLRAR